MWTKLYWTDGPWPGRVALASRPRGGDWLEDELARWHAKGVDVLCCLLEAHELADLDLDAEERLAHAAGLRFESFAIRDQGVPASYEHLRWKLRRFDTHLEAGRNVVVHCRQGVGRTGLVAACLLILNRVPAEVALQRISAARGVTIPETPEQKEWIFAFEGDCRKRC